MFETPRILRLLSEAVRLETMNAPQVVAATLQKSRSARQVHRSLHMVRLVVADGDQHLYADGHDL